MQAWAHAEHVTLPRALGHPWGKSSYIFYETFIAHTSKLQTLESGRGSPQRCGYLQDSASVTDPKTCEESRNDQMKSAEITSNMRGTGDIGRLQTTQGKGRQF